MVASKYDQLVRSRELVPEVLRGKEMIVIVEMPYNNMLAVRHELCPEICSSGSLLA